MATRAAGTLDAKFQAAVTKALRRGRESRRAATATYDLTSHP
jgi:hypothetical protein